MLQASCVYSYIHTARIILLLTLFAYIIQEKCVVRQDENNRYFVECGVPGEKAAKKRGKGPNSPGDNKKRPNSQVSKI